MRRRAELHAPAVLSQVQELLENVVYSRRHHAGPRLGIYAGADSHAQFGRHGLRNRGLVVFRGITRCCMYCVCFGLGGLGNLGHSLGPVGFCALARASDRCEQRWPWSGLEHLGPTVFYIASHTSPESLD